jgi:hypothetical protein
VRLIDGQILQSISPELEPLRDVANTRGQASGTIEPSHLALGRALQASGFQQSSGDICENVTIKLSTTTSNLNFILEISPSITSAYINQSARSRAPHIIISFEIIFHTNICSRNQPRKASQILNFQVAIFDYYCSILAAVLCDTCIKHLIFNSPFGTVNKS